MNINQLITQALGIPLQKSPVYTAKALLADCYKGKERIIRDTSFDLRDLPFYESAPAAGIVWRRPLEPSMIGMSVHAYDKASAFLSACSGTNTGVGDPVHLWIGDDNTGIKPGLPGIYRVAINRLPPRYMPYDGSFVPILDADQEWVTNDELIYAQQKGYEFTIIEAHVFEDYERILGNRDPKRNWALRIWNARQALKKIDEEAYNEMKVIATVGLGSFATGKDKYSGIRMIHPNWWRDVVSKSRINTLCNIEKYAKVFRYPVLVETDELVFVTRDPNFRTAVPGIFDRMGQLGGYNPEKSYSFILTEEIYEQAQGLTPGKLSNLFSKAGAK